MPTSMINWYHWNSCHAEDGRGARLKITWWVRVIIGCFWRTLISDCLPFSLSMPTASEWEGQPGTTPWALPTAEYGSEEPQFENACPRRYTWALLWKGDCWTLNPSADSLFFEMQRDESSHITLWTTGLEIWKNNGNNLTEITSRLPSESWGSLTAPRSEDNCLLFIQETTVCADFKEGRKQVTCNAGN